MLVNDLELKNSWSWGIEWSLSSSLNRHYGGILIGVTMLRRWLT